ncbi:MAG: HEAT repeat domain-containing protein [Elusimicrobia bacterium]|nr:HEAT repeat domain-containing protein [Elusimicrobiota bacterium]
MKWFLMLLIFVAGVYYMISRNKNDARRQELAQQANQELLKAAETDPELPDKSEKAYMMRFSVQTLKTLRSLTYDPNEKVRFAAIELLWQLQDERAPSIIKHMFQEETDAGVKKNILEMLSRDKTKLSLALLAGALNDYDTDTRIKVVEAIGNFSNKEAIVVLNKALEDYDEKVRLKAVEAVDRIRKDIEANKEQTLRDLQSTKPLFRIE